MAKYFYIFSRAGDPKNIDGIEVRVKQVRNKNKVVSATIYSVPLEAKVIFKLTHESWIDGVCKNLGLAEEFQTGDPAFDHKVYIASDSQSFQNELRMDAQSRDLILKLFQKSCDLVYCDGKNFSAHFAGNQNENVEALNLFVQLSKQLKDLEAQQINFLQDPFAMKILITEATIWSLATYAGISGLSWLSTREDIYLYNGPVIGQGVMLGIFITIAFGLFVAFFLKGSSRGHRVFVESIFILSLSVPIGGINLISDINIHMDKSSPIIIEAKIVDRYEREHRTRKGGKYYTYHINVVALSSTEPIDLPRNIEVTREVYRSVIQDKNIKIKVAQGHLNHPWYKEITAIY